MSTPKSILPTRRELPWLIIGVVLATIWFGANRALPPLFRGDVCCDSTGYITIAEKLAGVHAHETAPTTSTTAKPSTEELQLPSAEKHLSLPLSLSLFSRIFTYSGYTPPVFPLFLAAHAFGLKLIGLGALPWLPIALTTALVLHIFAAFFFYRSWRSIGWNVHPAALTLLIAHPGLTSHAALPLADSLAITLMMLGIGCLFRMQASSITRSITFASSGGVLLACAVLTKTSHFPAALIMMIGMLILPPVFSIIVRIINDHRHLGHFGHFGPLGPFCAVCSLSVLSFLFVLSPRLIACTSATGHICFSQPPSAGEPLTANLIRAGVTGARTYTVLAPKGFSALVTLSDPFFDTFRRDCTINDAAPLPSLLGCLVRHPLSTPVYLAKKSIGLFDNFHWNSYATYVTPLWVLVMNRIFGLFGFLGFFGLFSLAAIDIFRTPRRALSFLPLLFPLFFFLQGILLMIESRYGLPLAPFSIIGAVLLLQQIRQRRVLAVLSAMLGVLFLFQTFAWDTADPLPYQSVDAALLQTDPPGITAPLVPVQ